MKSRFGLSVILGGLLLLTAALVGTYYWAEGLWFAELGYLPEFLLRSRTQIDLGCFTFLVSLAITFYNLNVARKLQFNQNCLLPNQANLRVGLGLKGLLPAIMGLGLLLSAGLLYHGYLAYEELTSARAAVPAPFGIDFELDWVLAQRVASDPVALVVLVVVAIALVTFPQLLVRLGAIALSACFAIIAVEEWARVLRALYPLNFGQVDPVFGKELGYYIFKLPLLELINFWLSGLLLFVLCAVALMYLLAGNTFSQGRFAGFSSSQQRHLYAIAAAVLIFTSMSHWLNRFELLYSEQGVTYGASFTDIQVDLPVSAGLSLIALALALFLIWRTIFWPKGGIVPVRGVRGLRFVFAHPVMVAI
ncbi:MAG: UPF0182 family protein, partial [Pseudomonadota bacterium]